MFSKLKIMIFNIVIYTLDIIADIDHYWKTIGMYISGVKEMSRGISVSGIDNIAGKNIVEGSGTIKVSEQLLTSVREYAKALKKFLDKISIFFIQGVECKQPYTCGESVYDRSYLLTVCWI
jgi:hypothetical protein